MLEPQPTKYAKFNKDIILDLNYTTLEQAIKNINHKPILIRQNLEELGWSLPEEVIDLSVEQAEWLAYELLNMIKLLKEESKSGTNG